VRTPNGIIKILDALLPHRHEKPAVELNGLAKTLGAVDILYKAQRFHGYTDWTARGPIIHLSQARSDGRRRFTLAHECGHLIFDPARSATPDRVPKLVRDVQGKANDLRRQYDVERLCDLFATELLLPHDEMSAISRNCRSLEDLLRVADGYRVSLAMATFRLNAYNSDLAVLRLRRGARGNWVLVDRVALPARVAHLRGLPAESLKELDCLSPGVWNLWLEMEDGRFSLSAYAQVHKRANSMIIGLSRTGLNQSAREADTIADSIRDPLQSGLAGHTTAIDRDRGLSRDTSPNSEIKPLSGLTHLATNLKQP
jgi:Zn-dependent peptidase ImmA (M78 family)